MDVTSNFFIMMISICMYFFLIGLIYIKVVNPQYPLNWALVMKFMLGLNNFDNFNNTDNFTTISSAKEGFVSATKRPSVVDRTGSTVHQFSKSINWAVDWISIQVNRLLVKLYIDQNTFYSTQRINYRPLVSL